MILGVDPGLDGALALYQDGHANVWDMPHGVKGLDAPALAAIVCDITDLVPPSITLRAVIERVGSLPRQAGAFNFGLYAGIVHGVLAAHRIPFELVSPVEWKRAMGLGRGPAESKPENKSRARALAAQLFPKMAQQFSRVRDDGRAEALLLAVYYANRPPLPLG